MNSEQALAERMSNLSDAIDRKEDGKDPKNEEPLVMTSKWNNGWEASSKDKRFKYHVGSRVQFDGVFLQDNPAAFAGTGPFGIRTLSIFAELG